jgi:hypothetical protein
MRDDMEVKGVHDLGLCRLMGKRYGKMGLLYG